ncbi:MAG: hypothetical protein K2J83_05545 [Clostridia bacterium]|nr:hypothetical protein [Clostridia bacterium]
MKKKLLSILLTVCLACGGISLFAGCVPSNPSGPDTAPEYAQWLINKLKPEYSVSAVMYYVDDENPDKGDPQFEELQHLSTNFDAYVKKSGNTTVSTVQAVTYNDRDTVSTVKEEFTQSGDSFSVRVFDDSKRVAETSSLNRQGYLDETRKMLLPETLLNLCSETDRYAVWLRKNTAPKKYGYIADEEFTTLQFFGSMLYDSNDINSNYTTVDVDMEVVVWKNELSNITYTERGMDNDGNEFCHTAGLVYDNRQTPSEPFGKTGYYASETECAIDMLNGVLNNQPTTFQVVQSTKMTLNEATYPDTNLYVAYEKSGDTIYYYNKTAQNEDWRIVESYTKNGDGHIGRRYDSGTNTYKEHVCDKDHCVYVNSESPDDQHTFINATNTSFVAFAELLNATGYVVEFDADGVCTIVLEQSDDEAQVKMTVVIKDNVLRQMTLETTTEIPEIPGFTAGGTSVMTVTSNYTYNTAAINADLSGYSKA